MVYTLKAIAGLRTSAGEFRDRGGHDLRAWLISSCQEHGAHHDLLRVVTHTAKGDIVSGDTRATWATLCAEVAELRLLDAEPIELAASKVPEPLSISWAL